jgi:hypothetical protein
LNHLLAEIFARLPAPKQTATTQLHLKRPEKLHFKSNPGNAAVQSPRVYLVNARISRNFLFKTLRGDDSALANVH